MPLWTLNPMPPAGLPRGEVSEGCEDQDEGKGPRRYGPCQTHFLSSKFSVFDKVFLTMVLDMRLYSY